MSLPIIICIGSLTAVALLIFSSGTITVAPPPTFVTFSRCRYRRRQKLQHRGLQTGGHDHHRPKVDEHHQTGTQLEAAELDHTTMGGEEEKEDVCTSRRAGGAVIFDVAVHSCPDNASYPFHRHPPPPSRHSRLPSFSAPSYGGRTSLFDFSAANAEIMRGLSSSGREFNVNLSTQENYMSDDDKFYGDFWEIRAGIDRNYHGNYSQGRQELQDKIVHKMLDGATVTDIHGSVCKTPTDPWIVFTAGVMGAGKSHTMKQLSAKELFPLEAFVVVDPDEIRSHFPEFHIYAQSNPEQAGELTHREAGYLTEIVTAAALRCGHNVLVDGSLRDYEWYKHFFADLRREYESLRIAILHITAPRKAVFERAEKRARETGRIVPHESLEMSLEQVPISVKKLAPLADFFCELDNSYDAAEGGSEVRMITQGITWDAFRDNWAQTCPWVPPSLLSSSSSVQPPSVGKDGGGMMGKM